MSEAEPLELEGLEIKSLAAEILRCRSLGMTPARCFERGAYRAALPRNRALHLARSYPEALGAILGAVVRVPEPTYRAGPSGRYGRPGRTVRVGGDTVEIVWPEA